MSRWLFLTVSLTLLVAGCGPPDATFVFNERTEGLMPEAREGMDTEDGEHIDGVKDIIRANFGSPHELTAWTQLPINYGGVFASVSEPDSAKSFKVAMDGEGAVEGETIQIQWISGAHAGKTIDISEYDATDGVVTLGSMLEPAPVKGDKLVFQPGDRIINGRALYMAHCSHCHGTTGDGNGPTAKYLEPRPRDYRKGVFKFTGTKPQDRARRTDLHRIIKLGIPGTYMPSFMLLKDDEITAIVEYVRWLAMRGELEYLLGAELQSDYSQSAYDSRTSGEGGETRDEVLEGLVGALKDDLPENIGFILEGMNELWVKAETEEALIVPSLPRTPDSPESRSRGRALFLSAKAKCSNCHGPQGLGNGPQTEDYEEDPDTKEKYPEPGLHDDWGHIVKPRNLTTGIYRGGRRPIDIFRRIYSGVKGAKMTAFGGVLTDAEIWDLVNYVLSIPFGPTAPAAGVGGDAADNAGGDAAAGAGAETDSDGAADNGGNSEPTPGDGASGTDPKPADDNAAG